MGSIKSYEGSRFQSQMRTIKSEEEKMISNSRDFPNCKGLYPDCPETPDLMVSMCRTCPKTDGMKKPKIED